METHIPNTPNQALFQDPYVDFLKTSEEGIKVANNSISTSATKFFRTAVEKQSKWECPCLSYILKEMSKEQSWNHMIDWMYWKREFVS